MLTPYDATKDVTAVLDRLGQEAGGPVRVESRYAPAPATLSDAVLTTITKAGPGVDLNVIYRAVRELPGVIAASGSRRDVLVYRRKES
jgi:hypothetical protein